MVHLLDAAWRLLPWASNWGNWPNLRRAQRQQSLASRQRQGSSGRKISWSSYWTKREGKCHDYTVLLSCLKVRLRQRFWGYWNRIGQIFGSTPPGKVNSLRTRDRWWPEFLQLCPSVCRLWTCSVVLGAVVSVVHISAGKDGCSGGTFGWKDFTEQHNRKVGS